MNKPWCTLKAQTEPRLFCLQTFVPLLLQKVPSYSEHILEKECTQNAKKTLAPVLWSQGILLCNCLPERPILCLCVWCTALDSLSIHGFSSRGHHFGGCSCKSHSWLWFSLLEQSCAGSKLSTLHIMRIFWNLARFVVQGVNHRIIVACLWIQAIKFQDLFSV